MCECVYENNMQDSVLSFHHVGSKYSYPLSHQLCPSLTKQYMLKYLGVRLYNVYNLLLNDHGSGKKDAYICIHTHVWRDIRQNLNIIYMKQNSIQLILTRGITQINFKDMTESGISHIQMDKYYIGLLIRPLK